MSTTIKAAIKENHVVMAATIRSQIFGFNVSFFPNYKQINYKNIKPIKNRQKASEIGTKLGLKGKLKPRVVSEANGTTEANVTTEAAADDFEPFQLSNGSMWRFMKRHNLQSFTLKNLHPIDREGHKKVLILKLLKVLTFLQETKSVIQTLHHFQILRFVDQFRDLVDKNQPEAKHICNIDEVAVQMTPFGSLKRSIGCKGFLFLHYN